MSRPRIRSVKPEMRQDERYGRLSRDARELFNGLITMADDEGRIRALPAAILGHVFPYDLDAPAKLERWLGEIAAQGMVLRYEHESLPYIAFRHWRRHQMINRPRPSLLPAPPDQDVVTENAVAQRTPKQAEITDASVNDHGTEASPAQACARGIGSDQIKNPPIAPGGGKVIKFDGKPVPAERLELAQAILADFNEQAGTGYRPFTGRNRASEDLKRILGALADAEPPLTLDEAHRVTAVRLASPFWQGRPHTGVVFGPKVFAGNREAAAAPTNGNGHVGWSASSFVAAINGEESAAA